ncbi:MarR family winged helix-turn-helix transcriptional regulator [Noviherbaspirillum sedimenti]|uniref:MarR family transcriptional regulator n=1 Tax=Noviherbaspirillum sedimenti TaxID=2320865 RepID=A0A3A3G5G8_9BURK|nr:MarR family transcriptional regulator [Noviherbaspirillum sedimenti]RJG03181.1 MarR family transcriptional regulator [Noviherbaspirillum sedimenti]
MKKLSGKKTDSLANSKPESRKKEATENLLDAVIKDVRLGFLMHDVSRLRRTVFDEFMKPLGVTRSQWWVLAYLSRQDGMIQSDLADMLELGKAALGGLLDRLENTGLIERRPDELDRRVKRVYLTSEGTQTIKKMRVKSQEMSERMLEGLGLEDRHALADMLGLVKSNLLAINKNPEDSEAT